MSATAAASASLWSRLSHRRVPAQEPVRMVDPEQWQAYDVPLLRDPRGLLKRLHDLHRPEPGTAVVAVLDADGRPVASASFALDNGSGPTDGWECRNTILAHLRMIVPDDLRRATPTRTTVLLLCRDGQRDWEPDDGRWMWGLRDACGLHGLRCGAAVIMAEDGWQVVGDGRNGRTPAPVGQPNPARRPTVSASPRPAVPTPATALPTAAALPATTPPAATDTPHHPVARPHPPHRSDHAGVAVAAFAEYPEGPAPPPRPPVVRLVPDVATA
ncbi:hypothetical protein AB0C36_38070 [Streptodolium elevatio]|uniref:Uncharacterized protein n=1 Tax=Streptodolium elevatio TaxID=3157996 RepID=A0ABV3DU64_9ACTN